MAILDALPEYHVISGFKGVIDFYMHKGIPCVRTWPRKPRLPRSPAVQQGIDDFRDAMASLRDLDENTRSAFKNMAAHGSVRWLDLYVRAYISGIHP